MRPKVVPPEYAIGEEVEFQEYNRVWHRGTVTAIDSKQKRLQVDFKQHGKWKRLSLATRRARKLPMEEVST